MNGSSLTARALVLAIHESGRLTLSVAEVAVLCSISEHTVRDEIKKGSIPHERWGQRVIRIPAAPIFARLGLDFNLKQVPRETASRNFWLHADAEPVDN